MESPCRGPPNKEGRGVSASECLIDFLGPFLLGLGVLGDDCLILPLKSTTLASEGGCSRENEPPASGNCGWDAQAVLTVPRFGSNKEASSVILDNWSTFRLS